MDPTEAERPPLISYPTTYAFKVMGKHEHDFRAYVQALFSRLMGAEVSDSSVTEQPSRQGTYLSVTVTVELRSEEQRKTIYGALHHEKPRILYYL